MGKCFCAGLALGMLGGALLIANSNKARELTVKGQTEILDKLSELRKDEEKSSKSPTKKSENERA